MLEQELGREAVIEALRAVYRDFRGRAAAWSDFLAALEAASGRDLSAFADQWLTRVGAPTLQIAGARRDGDTVRLTLRQTDPAYDLLVPVVIATPGGEVRHRVRFTAPEQSFDLIAPGATELRVDPDNDLFRHLDPTEIEPTLSQVFAVAEHVFVPPVSGGLIKLATATFAADFCECDEPVIRDNGEPDEAAVNVIINPAPSVFETRQPSQLQVHGDLVFLDGRRFDLKEHDVVLAVAAPGGPTDLVILTRNAGRLKGLGTRLGHYGKYSWLVFPAGGGQVERGNWQPAANPLTVSLVP
jgi:hypothetical protein